MNSSMNTLSFIKNESNINLGMFLNSKNLKTSDPKKELDGHYKEFKD